MATLDELVVTLVAETSGLRAELDKASKATQKATEAMDNAIADLNKNSSKNLSFVEQSFATMTGFLASNVVTGAVDNLKQAFTFLSNELLAGAKAAAEEELQLTKLANALQLSGQYSQEALMGLKDFANEMEATTGVEDELILSNLALLSSMTKLDSEGLKKAETAAINLAAAYDMDLRTATTMVGKAVEGNTSQFQRYGISVEEGANKAENLDNVLRALATTQGAAAGTAETYDGLTKRLGNSYGDLTKEAGKALVQNQAVDNVLRTLIRSFDDTTESIEGNHKAIKLFVADGLTLFLELAAMTTTAIDSVGKAFDYLTAAIEKTSLPIRGILSAIAVLKGEGPSTLEKVTVKLMEMQNAAQAGSDAIKAGTDKIIESNVQGGASFDALTEKQRANAEKGKELSEQLIADMEGTNEAKLALFEEQNIAEDELLAEAREAKLISEEAYLAARAELNEKYDKKIADSFVKNEQTKAQNAAKWASYHIDLANNIGNLLIATQGKNSKAAFVIQKAAAIAQSIVATNLAAAQALAVPPAPNVGLAGVAKAAGYANTAAIVATAVQGLNQGIDSVPGVGNRDTVPAMLTPGERVIDQGTNKDLKQYLANANANGGSGGGRYEISIKDDFMNFIELKLVERRRTGESLLRDL